MATLVIPGAYQVSILGESGGQSVTNVIGVSGIGGQAENIANAVATAYKVANGPLARQHVSYSLLGIRCVDLSSPTGQVAEVTATGAGSVSAAKATNGSCAVVKMKGNTRSRSTSGRLYHGPLSEASIDPDGRTLLASFGLQVAQAYLAFHASLISDGYDWVVLSRKLSIFTRVSSISTDGLIGTQRRRIRGR